jgi:hypothetical protein
MTLESTWRRYLSLKPIVFNETFSFLYYFESKQRLFPSAALTDMTYINEMKCLYFAVRTESWNIIQFNHYVKQHIRVDFDKNQFFGYRYKASNMKFTMSCGWSICRGADKSLARPGRKQDIATEDFDFRVSYNHNWRNISTIYTYNKTSIKRNILTIKQNTSGSSSGWGLISTPVLLLRFCEIFFLIICLQDDIYQMRSDTLLGCYAP